MKARITGRLHSCLLDSGADVSLAPSQLVDPDLLRPSTTPLVAVNNTSLVVDGIATLPVTVNGIKTFADFTVTPNIDEVILGRDWLTENSVVWKFSAQQITLQNHLVKLHHRFNNVNACKRCVTKNDVTIPARSEAIVPAHIVYSKLDCSSTAAQQWSTTLHTPADGLRVARTLIDSDTGSTGVRLCNITGQPVRLHRGCTVSPLQPVSPLPTAQPDTGPAPDASPGHVAPIIDSGPYRPEQRQVETGSPPHYVSRRILP